TEIVGHNPTIIVDGAHNADSMHKLLLALRSSFTFRRLLVVVSISRDKDLTGMVKMLAEADEVILTSMNSPRVADTTLLAQLFAEHAPHVRVRLSPDTQQAMDLACQRAASQDLICATGSIYFAAEALRWAAAHGDQTAASEIEGVDH
ncbi:MAG: hypothetical protein J2P36_10565, partial [Ktedonobacteraceae bacterium]|nr:hypothetical protein [Ktedonobacteraceae bacterium]